MRRVELGARTYICSEPRSDSDSKLRSGLACVCRAQVRCHDVFLAYRSYTLHPVLESPVALIYQTFLCLFDRCFSLASSHHISCLACYSCILLFRRRGQSRCDLWWGAAGILSDAESVLHLKRSLRGCEGPPLSPESPTVNAWDTIYSDQHRPR